MINYCFEYEIQVRDYECDMQGIVNNAVYQNYFEHVRHQFLKSAGDSFSRLHDEGIDPVVNRVEIDYKTSLRSGDSFICKLAIERKGIRYIFFQDIYRKPDNALCAKARIEVVSLYKGKLTKGDEFLPIFEKYLNK